MNADRQTWHFPFIRYGNDISDCNDVKSALIESDMYWRPEIADMETITMERRADEDRIERHTIVPHDYRMVYRRYDNGRIDFIAPVKSRYTVSDPIKNFMMFDEWVRNGKMSLISAGNLDNKFLWMFAKINTSTVKIGNDVIEWHVIAYDKFDRGAAIHIIFMPIRSYCTNGLFVTDRHGKIFELRQVHVGRSTIGIDNKIGFVMNQFDQYHRMFYAMQEERYTKTIADKVYRNYINRVMFENSKNKKSTRRKNIVNEINRLAQKEVERNAGYSLWGIYNAVIEYTDYVYPNQSKNQQNVYNLIIGHGGRIKRNAWKEAIKLLDDDYV